MKLIKRMRVVPVDHERYFILNGVTGVIDLIDEAVYQLYVKWSKMDEIIPENSFEEEMLSNFLKREYIMEPKVEEEKIERLFSDLDYTFTQSKPKVSPIFILTYDCNFRCSYCYEKHLLRRGREKIKQRLTPEMIQVLFRSFAEKGMGIGNVGLYGGEPLLPENEDTVREILRQAIERDLEVHLTTNGYTLDQYAPLLATANITHIQITLDGAPARHNQTRHTIHKEGTFDQIVKNVRFAREYNLPITLRCNVELDEENQVRDLISALEVHGLNQDPGIELYFAPVSHNDEPACTKDFWIQFISKVDQFITYPIVQKNFLSRLHNMASIFFDHSKWAPKYVFCSAQVGKQVFDPWGFIYSCQVLVGEEHHAIGTFDENGIRYNQNYPLWNNRTIKNMSRCRDCEVALFCGGGCALASIDNSGRVDDGDCSQMEDTLQTLLPYLYKNYFAPRSGVR